MISKRILLRNILKSAPFEEGDRSGLVCCHRTAGCGWIKNIRILYFRNALVRANYSNIKKGIYETTEYLELFLQNLLLDGENELHNREMHVSGKFSRKQDIDPINDPINTAGLSEREKKVLELLRQDPTLTRAKMAEILGCSDATIKRALGTMVQKSVIRRIGSNKKGEWIINL